MTPDELRALLGDLARRGVKIRIDKPPERGKSYAWDGLAPMPTKQETATLMEHIDEVERLLEEASRSE
jgi:hypothetical protein